MSITKKKFYAINIHLSSNVLSMTIIYTSSFNQKIINECCVAVMKSLIRLTHDIKNQTATKKEKEKNRLGQFGVLFSVKLIEKHVNIYDYDNYNYFLEIPTI